MGRALVLHSGGMDSTTALWIAGHKHDAVGTLNVNYGSRHNNEELFHAALIRTQFKKEYGNVYVGHHRINLTSDIFIGAGSTLMREGEIPSEEYHDPDVEKPSSTVVPFRNGVLLSLATAYAASHGFDTVVFAAHANDAIGFAYPDCTPEFVGAMTAGIYIGTHREVRLDTPFQWFTKSFIVSVALKYSVPLGLSYSCYRGGTKHCGECPTCRERLNAFKENHYVDPAEYGILPDDFAWDETDDPWPYQSYPVEPLDD
jgi:7-cyano-7-deazaguanine synthase